jgi:hypothetical protein
MSITLRIDGGDIAFLPTVNAAKQKCRELFGDDIRFSSKNTDRDGDTYIHVLEATSGAFLASIETPNSRSRRAA